MCASNIGRTNCNMIRWADAIKKLELVGHAVYGMPEGICIMKKPNPWDRIAPADCVNPAT